MVADFDGLAMKLMERDRKTYDLIKKYAPSGFEKEPMNYKDMVYEEIKKSLIETEEEAKRHSVTRKDNIFHNPCICGPQIAENARLMAEVKYSMMNRKEDIEIVLYSAEYHDHGKAKVKLHLFFKNNGKIAREDFEEIKKHSEYGAEMIKHPYPKFLIYHHHEWWNGKGYPDGLKGRAIPLGSRIILIADAFDAMTHNRPYQKAFSKEQALETLKKQAEICYDPELVEIFIAEITKKYNEENLEKKINNN